MPINGLPGGDFAGCVAAMAGKVDNPQAFCAWKEHELTGKWPAEEAAAPDYSGHAMIALEVPSDIAEKMALSIPGALSADELHITLAYLGTVENVDKAAQLEAAKAAAMESGPVSGHVNGYGVFENVETGKNALVALFDSKDIQGIYHEVKEALEERGLQSASTHGFTPHITLAYVDSGSQIERPELYTEEFSFNELYAVHGDEWMPVQFQQTGPAQESFHETFNASLSIRESKQPNTVLLDGVVIVEGMSANHNNYTLEALNSAPAVFANRPIRVNHPSRSDDRDRPEGDLWTQVGKLPGPDGFKVAKRPDGLHEVQFYGAILSYSDPDKWIADRIRAGIIGDMSINAGGKGVREASGFKVTEFTEATSHDLVTVAAAGGKATALHESDGGTMKKRITTEAAVTAVMESAKLPPEVRPLLEAEAARLTEMADGETQPAPAAEVCAPAKEAAPEFLKDLPEPVQTAWIGAFDQCMAGDGADEMACGNMAWLTVVKSLAPAAPPAEEAEPMKDEEPAMAEALAKYAAKLRAALAQIPGAGSVQGMGTGAAPKRESAAPQPRDTKEWMMESYSKIPGFTKEMAETAAKGR